MSTTEVPRGLEDLAIAGIVGWEVASAVAPMIPTPSSLLRRAPAWGRCTFAAALAGIVLVHLGRKVS